MNVFPLTVPLAALFGLTNLCGSSFACSPRFALDAGANRLPLLSGDLGLHFIVFAHGSSFPFADATAHQLWAVGFSNVDAIREEVEHADIASVKVHLELASFESREQAGADVPTPLKREPVV